jgi:hypothetical protein
MIADPAFPYSAAIRLGHPDPSSILPSSYGMVLRNWPGATGRAGR